ncbi:MAG: TIGR02757 family protein [Bacteroidota bacterium]
MEYKELKELLEYQTWHFNQPMFIETDPVSIPHLFSQKEDIEIAAFLSAIISWGYRPNIVKSAKKLINLLNNKPFEFIMHAGNSSLKPLQKFVYRTFNANDLLFFLASIKNIYGKHGGLENVFNEGYKKNQSIKESIINFRKIFFETEHYKRSEKHISDPEKNSAAKRINLFLRWMVRNDNNGVDFGIWKKINPSHLMCPLDLHSGNTARKLGLLQRKQNDWKAVEELTGNLKKFDLKDPVKYDFALFGISVNEKR